MRKLFKITSILIYTGLFQSCLLATEYAFKCEKNAALKLNGMGKCAFEVGNNYNQDTNTLAEKITINFSYGVGSGTMLITAFNRTARTISGEFNITTEGAANYTAYDYEISGNFNEASF